MKLATLKDSGRLLKAPKDKVLFKKGDSGFEMYIILSGAVNIYANEYSKDTPPLVILKNGDFFGEMALLEDFPRSTTAVAKEECLFLVINKVNFEKAIKDDPGFAIKIMQSLSNRLRLQTKRYAELEERLCVKGPVPEPESQVLPSENKEINPSASAENQKNFSFIVEEKPELIFNEETLIENFFPQGHILYNVPEPDSYKNFIVEKEKECPACGTVFNAFLVRHSKLNLDKIEDDYRLVYKDFDPIWYSIWTCPNCYYANFYEEFPKKLHSYHQELILKRKDILRRIFNPNNNSERTIDDVLNDYYQAIQSLIIKKEHSKDLGKIWMRLAWLYKDLGDKVMYEKSSLQAFAYYYDYYYNSGAASQKEDQQLSYILGLFFLKFNNPTNARKHFLKAIIKKDGDQRINDQAYDQIQDIKKAEKASS